MPDIFDTIETEPEVGGADIFDEIAPETGSSNRWIDAKRRFESGVASSAANAGAAMLKTGRDIDSLTGGAISGIANTLTGRDLNAEITEYLRGQAKAAPQTYQVNPQFNDTLLADVASGAGSLAPTMIGTLVNPALGIATASGMMGEASRAEAEQAGASEEQQNTAFYANAAVGAVTEKLMGVGKLLKSAQKLGIPAETYGQMAQNAAKQAVLSAGREGGQEGIQTVAENLIASELAAYEPERDAMEGVVRAMLAGAIVGGPLGGAVQVGTDLSRGHTTPLPNEGDGPVSDGARASHAQADVVQRRFSDAASEQINAADPSRAESRLQTIEADLQPQEDVVTLYPAESRVGVGERIPPRRNGDTSRPRESLGTQSTTGDLSRSEAGKVQEVEARSLPQPIEAEIERQAQNWSPDPNAREAYEAGARQVYRRLTEETATPLPEPPQSIASEQPVTAVRSLSGEIFTDPEARTHAELVERLGLDPATLSDGGFVVNGEYREGSADAGPMSERARAAERVRQRRAARLQAQQQSGQTVQAQPSQYPPTLGTSSELRPDLQTRESVAERSSYQPRSIAPPTSTKNEITTQERSVRGIQPAEEAARRDFGTVWQEAEANASQAESLVDQLAENPRAVTDLENALVLRRQIELQNEFDRTVDEVNQTQNEEAKARLENVRDKLQKVYDVTQSIGTETGRGLNARKMLALNDFSLARMEAKMRAENGGRKLTERELAEVQALHDKIAEQAKKLEQYERRGGNPVIQARQYAKLGKTAADFFAEQASSIRSRRKPEQVRFARQSSVPAQSTAALIQDQTQGQVPSPGVDIPPVRPNTPNTQHSQESRYDLASLEAMAKSNRGVATLGELIRDPQWRADLGDVLDTQITTNPRLRESIRARVGHFGQGTLEAKDQPPWIEVNPARLRNPDEVAYALLHEAAHIKRLRKGRRLEESSDLSREQYQSAPYEHSATKFADHLWNRSPQLRRSPDDSADIDSATGQVYSLSRETRAAFAPAENSGARMAVQAAERKLGGKAKIEVVVLEGNPNPRDRQTLEAVSRLAKRNGNEVVYVRSDQPLGINGWYFGRKIFLNVDSVSDPLHVVAGHEVWHGIEQNDPILARSVKRAIRLNPDLYRRYKENALGKGYETGEIQSEFVADLVGETMADPVRLNQAIGGGLAKRIFVRVQQWLTRALDFLKRNQRNLEGASAAVRNLTEVQERIVQALREPAAKAAATRAPAQRTTSLAPERLSAARPELQRQASRQPNDPSFKRQSPTPDESTVIGAAHIAKGTTEYEAWAKAMREDGETPSPELFQKSRAYFAEIEKEFRTPEEKRLDRAKQSTAKRTEDYQRRTAEGDFESRKREPVEPDDELTDLRYELDEAKKEYYNALATARRAQRTNYQKTKDAIGETFNTSRAVMSSADFSAVLRQGGFLVLSHPIRASKSLVPMLKATMSEKQQFRVMDQIRRRPNAELYKRARLFIADTDAPSLIKSEEAYASRIARHIPGVRASERAYTVFLNKLRADSFDSMVATLSKGGKPSLEESRSVAAFINAATGRGDLGRAAAAGDVLSKLLFSPRFLASRIQILTGQPIRKAASGRVRAQIVAEYGRMLTGLSVIYGLSVLAGAKIEDDPRSSDFGKLRFGNTRIDPMFGLSQVAVFMSRMATGETKREKGEIKPLRKDYRLLNLFRSKKRTDEPGYKESTGVDIAMNFARTKASPIVSGTWDFFKGKDFRGEPVDLTDIVLSRAYPMPFNDLYEVMRAHDVPEGTALSMLALFGAGVDVRADKNDKKASLSDAMQEWYKEATR